MARTIASAILLTAAISTGSALAQQSAPAAPTASESSFVAKQATGEFRASKFVGLDVYGSEGSKVGDIAEILLDSQGQAKAVVVMTGGFLGMGAKKVAVPWTSVTWSNDAPPMQTASDRPASTGSTGTAGGAMTGSSPAPAQTPARSPAEQAAYNGYPNHAKVQLTMAQFKEALEFKFVSDATASESK